MEFIFLALKQGVASEEKHKGKESGIFNSLVNRVL